MITMKIFNEFKVVVYPLIVIVIFGMKFAGWIPKSLDNILLISIVVVAVLSLVFFIEFIVRKIIEKRSKTKSALNELRYDLSRNRRKAVIVIRNAPFSDLALRKQFTTVVQEKDWWDWSYIGFHPDCDKLCDELFQELKDVYIDSPESDKIKTSSLAYLHKYPFKRRSLVFMGDIVVPKNGGDPKDFPEHIWYAILEKEYATDFHKLYIIESAWKAGKTECTIRNIDIERDSLQIEQQWNEVSELIKREVANTDTLVYKDHLPQANQRRSFFANLERNVCKICESSLFVVSPSAGTARSIVKEGFSGHFWAKFFLFVGWSLSPLSFYNDIYVNLPATLLISYLLIHFRGWNKAWATGTAYTFTNILGFVLICFGLHIARKEPKWRLSIVRTSIIFTVYLTAISMMGKFVFEIDWCSVFTFVSRLL